MRKTTNGEPLYWVYWQRCPDGPVRRLFFSTDGRNARLYIRMFRRSSSNEVYWLVRRSGPGRQEREARSSTM